MSDIIMCDNRRCPKCFECLRFIAVPDESYQSYFNGHNKINKPCEYFVQANELDKDAYEVMKLEKVAMYNKRYYQKNKERLNKKNVENTRKRIQKLRDQGCINATYVICKGGRPKWRSDSDE